MARVSRLEDFRCLGAFAPLAVVVVVVVVVVLVVVGRRGSSLEARRFSVFGGVGC